VEQGGRTLGATELALQSGSVKPKTPGEISHHVSSFAISTGVSARSTRLAEDQGS